jgi:IS5 family transposase
MQLSEATDPMVEAWRAGLRHYRPLIERIIWQTEHRVLCGEPVAAGEKLVSLFEPHADIIVKGSRDVDYGHKLNLTTGRSGLILDPVIEAGNPADSRRSGRCPPDGQSQQRYEPHECARGVILLLAVAIDRLSRKAQW